jgi:hypothetical protein
VRIVVSNADPGVANWLDTEGRAEVLATIRWFRPPEQPKVRTQIVPRAQLTEHLPPDAARVDAPARRDQVRHRAAHSAWRYRT